MGNHFLRKADKTSLLKWEPAENSEYWFFMSFHVLYLVKLNEQIFHFQTNTLLQASMHLLVFFFLSIGAEKKNIPFILPFKWTDADLKNIFNLLAKKMWII